MDHSARRQGPSCFSATPWLGLVCALLVSASIPVWFIFSSSAAGNTQRALQDTDIATDVLAEVISAFHTLRVVVVVLLSVCLALVLVVAVLGIISKMHRLKGGPQCGYLSFSAVGTLLLWLTLIGVVALVAVCVTWLVGSWAASAVLQKASGISTSAEAAAQRAVDTAQQLVSDLKTTQLNILDSAPADIKSSGWFKDYYSGVQDINATSLLPSNLQSSTSSACQPGCISLDVLAGLAGMENGCLCITNTLQSLQEGLTRTKQNMLPAVIALAVCYLAGSALLIHFAANYTAAKYLRKQRKAAASSSNLLLTQSSNSGGNSRGPYGLYSVNGNGTPYRGPADAAVDIHGVSGIVRPVQQKPEVHTPSSARLAPVTIGLSNDGYDSYNSVSSPTEQDILRSRDAGGGYPPMSHLFGRERPVTPGDTEFTPSVQAAAAQPGIKGRYGSSIQLPEQQRGLERV